MKYLNGVSMKNLILLISALILFQSCGGGVSDRTVTSGSGSGNNSNLSPAQIESLAYLRISEDLQELGIIEYYNSAEASYPVNSFTKIEDFALVKCNNTIHRSVFEKTIAYGAMLGEVSNLLLYLEQEYNLESESSLLSVDELVVLLSAREKVASYNSLIYLHSEKCKSVIIVDKEDAEKEEVPVGPAPSPGTGE